MKEFSKEWKASTKPRKQRKYRKNMPLHLRAKLMRIHLSKTLRSKFNSKNVRVRKGDKVIVLTGEYKGREGAVERIDSKRERLYITGIESVKKDGTKTIPPIHPSNVIAVELLLADKRRKEKLEAKKK